MSETVAQGMEPKAPQAVKAAYVCNWDEIPATKPRPSLHSVGAEPVKPAAAAEHLSGAVITMDMMAGGEIDHFIIKGGAA